MNTLHTDEKLIELFQPEHLKEIFSQYQFHKENNTKRKLIPAGADNVTQEVFRRDLDLLCRLIAHRVLSGTYQFFPSKEQAIKKASTKQRVVLISTIRDILVQKIILQVIYDQIEELFEQNPPLDQAVCSARKGRSTTLAALNINRYIKAGYHHAVSADVIHFYDSIPQAPLIEKINNLFGEGSLTTKLLVRLIRTGSVPLSDPSNGHRSLKPRAYAPVRKVGIPVGSVVSGVLSNLYLYDFDVWVVSDLAKRYPLHYVRHVDNLLFLTQEGVSSELYPLIAEQLKKMGLTLHDSKKLKIYDVRQSNLEFVDFQFSLTEILIGARNYEEFKRRIRYIITKNDSSNIPVTDPHKRFLHVVYRLNKALASNIQICPVCHGMRLGIKSWIRFFSVITKVDQLSALDKWIRQTLSEHFYTHHHIRLKRRDFRNANLISLEQGYFYVHKLRRCKCDTNWVQQ